MADAILTIALSTCYSVETISRTLASIAAQTIADRITLLLAVNPGTDVASVRPYLDAVDDYRVHDTVKIDTVDRSSACLAFKASTPYVACVEDHVFLDPEWAEKIVDTFEKTDADVVGTGVFNANPDSLLSWANFSLAYSYWSVSVPSGPSNWVSHHNGSFRKSLLEKFDAKTAVDGFNREGQIIRDIIDSGGKLYFTNEARLRHINPSNWRSTFTHRTDVGRLYAANRAREGNWGLGKRALYVALSPAIPFLRYARERSSIFAVFPEIREVTHFPAVMIGLIFDAIGQVQGYLVGEGDVRQRLTVFEMDRPQHLNARDRKALYAMPEAMG
ncbi:hypothetical protein SuNHUV7_41180 (plasmid) [Pseudoseohaeicola sp. NH-UV-7]|uniref:glycosyltransferase n=1 Tax=Sulfitobacter sp. TBRI5 TaxID=2989732 RepID=UPI003A62DF6C